ncbi:MAG: histidine kinase [Myxococcota bacterium]
MELPVGLLQQRPWSWGRAFAYSAALWTIAIVVDIGKDSLDLIAKGAPLNWQLISDSTIWWGILIILTPPVSLLAHRMPPQRGHLRVILVTHIPVFLVFVLLHQSLATLGFRVLTGDAEAQQPWDYLHWLLARFFWVDLFLYLAIVAATWASYYNERYRARTLMAVELKAQAAQLERMAIEARLEALRWQLNPHFLFNALNAVVGLVRRDDRDAAVAMLVRISTLLRSTLDDATVGDVPLAREFELLDLYVAIERARFGERLRIDLYAEDETLDVEVPALLLQPLVENAIRHGMGASSQVLDIKVEARRNADALELIVRDSGMGFSKSGDATGAGIGLSNTRARLKHRYGDSAHVGLATDDTGGVVSVSVPWPRSAA